MIRVVLFDVDGVLIDIDFFVEVAEKKYGIKKAENTKFFKSEFRDCIVGKKDLKTAIEPYLKVWGWEKSVDDYLMEWFSYETKLNNHLVDYVQKLRSQGIKCYVATNQEKYRVAYLLNNLDLASKFDGIYDSASLGFKKPDLKFYEKIHEDLKDVKKEDILLWDDKDENVQNAIIFGFCGELYTNFEDFKEKMSSYV